MSTDTKTSAEVKPKNERFEKCHEIPFSLFRFNTSIAVANTLLLLTTSPLLPQRQKYVTIKKAIY